MVSRAEFLDKFLKAENTAVAIWVELKVADEKIIKGILEREKTSGRADEQGNAMIQNRIDIYNNQTVPVEGYYANFGKSKEVDGIGGIDEIFGRICKELDTVAV